MSARRPTREDGNGASDLIAQWDNYYRTPSQTPWEMIDHGDLPCFLRASGLPLGSVTSLVSVGCGRGQRDLEMLHRIGEFNTPGFEYVGIDISPVAIRQAAALFSHEASELACRWNFTQADLFALTSTRTYDVVLDWMCLHDIEYARLPIYAAKIAAMARSMVVVKLFSEEGSTVLDLGLLGRNIQKQKISEQDVLRLFGSEFELVFMQQYEEDLRPIPRPPDGIVAAKRAYVLRRRRALS